jgi:hypothetical protein
MTRALTLSEAAQDLRKSKRWLQDWLAKNPLDAFGRPFCSKLGRTRVFDDADISRIKEANRVAPCPSKSSRREKVKPELHDPGDIPRGPCGPKRRNY